jgi:hypothetical protein
MRKNKLVRWASLARGGDNKKCYEGCHGKMVTLVTMREYLRIPWLPFLE